VAFRKSASSKYVCPSNEEKPHKTAQFSFCQIGENRHRPKGYGHRKEPAVPSSSIKKTLFALKVEKRH
jgi:hypothetical protein